MVKLESLKKNQIRIVTGTPGGETHYVILPGEKEERPLCMRRIHTDHSMRCTNPAGYKTDHNGTGACSYHGGAAHDGVVTSVLKTGKYASASRARLKVQVDTYLSKDRKELLDLTEQLAYGKVVFDELVDNFPDPTDEKYGIWLNRFMNILSSLGSLVEKMSRMDTRNTLTAAQVLYLRATVADILMKYLTDPYDRERAAKELSSRLGGEVETTVTMLPSEVNMEDVNV